jgi:hypothetical protein
MWQEFIATAQAIRRRELGPELIQQLAQTFVVKVCGL